MESSENSISNDSINTCANCGSENPQSAKFCLECGQNLQVNTPTESFCQGCGIISPPGTKFCPECGQNLLDQPSTTPNGSLSNLLNNKKSVTQRKGLAHKLFSDAGKAAVKATNDIKKSIQDYTLAVEVKVTETHEDMIVTVELPKIKKEDLDINITPRKIILKAEFDHEVEIEQGTQIIRKEMQRGSINKSIMLRKEVIPEKAEAEYNNDILILKIPKADLVQGYKLKL